MGPTLVITSTARQCSHWRTRGGAGRRAILSSVGDRCVPGWQYWHSGLPGLSGLSIRVGIRHELHNWVLAIVVSHHDRGRRERTAARLAPEQVAVVIQVSAAMRA
jgi:hypothetical protein